MGKVNKCSKSELRLLAGVTFFVKFSSVFNDIYIGRLIGIFQKKK